MLLNLLLILMIILVFGLIISPNKNKSSVVAERSKKTKTEKIFSEAEKQKLMLKLGKKTKGNEDNIKLKKLYLFDFGDSKPSSFEKLKQDDKFLLLTHHVESYMNDFNEGDLACFKSE